MDNNSFDNLIDGNYLEEGWIDAETGRAYTMRGLWITPVYWMQKADLYFYKLGINATGSLLLLLVYIIKTGTF